MGHPLIHVIIPTRERADVLGKALATTVAQDYDNLRILVSDNCSADHTQEVVRQFRDPRITYLNTGQRLSMSHNWEFALGHVQDGWVTILGDDDALIPGALSKVSAIIAQTGTQAIRAAVCNYQWPELTGRAHGRLEIPRGTGFEEKSTRDVLMQVLGGCAPYPSLPMLYNGGFVSMAVINSIRARTGTFYHSSTPDVYSAMAIARTIPSFVQSREPLALNGASRHSNGTSQFSAGKDAKGSPSAKFFSEPNIPYHDDVVVDASGRLPMSLQLLVYEAYLQSAFLSSNDHGVTAGEQLKLILASEGIFASEVRPWAALFAQKHGLSLDDARQQASTLAARRRHEANAARIATAIDTIVVDSPRCPLADVQRASLVAAQLIAHPPSRLRAVPRLVRRAWEIATRKG